MSDQQPGFRRGPWPTDPRAFADTRCCPFCFALLSSSRCANCGLETNVPLAARLLEASDDVVAALAQREGVLERMWAEQHDRQRLAASVPAPTQPAATQPAAQPAAQPAETQPATAPIHAGGPAPAPPQTATVGAPRRSGVQVFLLVIGIVLVSIFALFFLAIAYLVASMELRAIVTGLASLATFGVARILVRRRLPGTAEGVGVAATAILVSDLGFVRAAGLFGSASVDACVFMGLALIVTALALTGIHRSTGLRFASIGATLFAPLGALLAVFGFLHPIDTPLAWFAALTAGGLVCLPRRTSTDGAAERLLGRSAGFSLGTGAFIPAGLVFGDSAGLAAAAYAVLAAFWGCWILRHPAHPLGRGWFDYAAVAAGLAVVLSPTVAIARASSLEWALWAPGAAAAAVAVSIVLLSRRAVGQAAAYVIDRASIPALSVAALALLPGTFVGLAAHASVLVPKAGLWRLHLDAVVPPSMADGRWASVLAPGIAGLALAVILRVRWPGHSRTTLVVVPISLLCIALLAAAALPSTVVTLALAQVLVVAGVLVALLLRQLTLPPGARVALRITLALATTTTVVLTLTNDVLWIPGLGVAICAAVLYRSTIRPRQVEAQTTENTQTASASAAAGVVARALLSGTAATVTVPFLVLFVPWLIGWRPGAVFGAGPAASTRISAFDFTWLLAGVAGVVLIAVAAVARSARPHADTRAIAIVAMVSGGLGGAVALSNSEDSVQHVLIRALIVALLLAAAILWQVRASIDRWGERVALAASVPILLLAACFEVDRGLNQPAHALTTDDPPVWSVLVFAVAGILGASLAIVLYRRRSRMNRIAHAAGDAAVALLVLLSVVSGLQRNDSLSWLTLLFCAVVPILVSASDGNVFTATSWRRHLAWIALPLAVGALWQYLAYRETADVEPYTLPVAGLLVALGVLVALMRAPAQYGIAGRTTLVSLGVALALVPSALLVAGDSPTRALTVLAAGLALVAFAIIGPVQLRGVPVRLISLFAGVGVLVIAGLIRSLDIAVLAIRPGLLPEAWIAPAVLALVTVGVVGAISRRFADTSFGSARVAIPLAIATLAVVEIGGIATAIAAAQTRAVFVVVVFSLVMVVSAWVGRIPFDSVTRYTALSAAILVGLTALGTGAVLGRSYVHPFELMTVPVALSLCAAGVIGLLRNPATRTWPQLGGAAALLLVPSLLPDFVGTELWRAVALGVACVLVIVAALLLRWQAPLVVSGSVLLVHAVAQSWPWIVDLYSAVPLWLWLGVGGVLLIVLAARYEHRVRNLKSFVGSISALR